MSTYNDYAKKTPLECVWSLYWDRTYGPRIQRRLRAGKELDDGFCERIKEEALAELRYLETVR